ncbi:glycosyltransferase family 2 protein [Bifidobacterium mongoliense]|uniref:Glycosyl transferase CpsJ n=1 Tax=Bifidobacterium mongoliense TaxID=518643 RepID=A0A423UFV0_9BIFI|nr:glycosyltransferase family A protein [Bifidobacterium mongoliense]ROT87596.1 glycosyl transferase CpsJ [Bifidobacterium mongoliense]
MEFEKFVKNDVKQGQLISVVVPVYNVCEYLEDCLRSLLAQTYVNMEILLVDDGSTDGSSAICDNFAITDRRIRVIHQENKGQSAARNVGTSCAHGDWLVYVDSDDVVSPRFLEHLYVAAILNDSNMAICKGIVFGKNEVFHVDESNRVTVLDADSAVIELLSERRASTAPWGKLARSNIWKSLPFPEDRKFEDLAITWKALDRVDSVALLDGSYYGYREREASTSHSPRLQSVMDYRTSIQQLWLELIPNSSQKLRAKCFRCCLEYCRLLEMIDRLIENTTLDRDERQMVLGVRRNSVIFLRRYCCKGVRNVSAPFSQCLRIAVTAIVPSFAIHLMKLRK